MDSAGTDDETESPTTTSSALVTSIPFDRQTVPASMSSSLRMSRPFLFRHPITLSFRQRRLAWDPQESGLLCARIDADTTDRGDGHAHRAAGSRRVGGSRVSRPGTAPGRAARVHRANLARSNRRGPGRRRGCGRCVPQNPLITTQHLCLAWRRHQQPDRDSRAVVDRETAGALLHVLCAPHGHLHPAGVRRLDHRALEDLRSGRAAGQRHGVLPPSARSSGKPSRTSTRTSPHRRFTSTR